MLEKMKLTYRGKEAIKVKLDFAYSLKDTFECGQAFRYEKTEEEDGYIEYFTITGNTLVKVGQSDPYTLYFYDTTEEEFEKTIAPYFALETNLEEIRRDILKRTDSNWLVKASEVSRGIAILKQEPWEALISFIISQNNNIPRIRRIIREISAEYGVNITLQSGGEKKCPYYKDSPTPCEEKCKKCGRCYTFPTCDDIINRPEGLLPSKPGFRYKYILDAAERVKDGRTNLDMIGGARSFNYTLERLKEIKGVGDKVASCVALYGFANLEAFPIDVWMKRAIDTYFDGKLDPLTLGRYAGYAQQYIFHYIRNIEGKQ